MRKLIIVPMLHSKEALAAQSNFFGEAYAGISSEAAATRGVSDEYWRRLSVKLEEIDVSSPHIYFESYSGPPGATDKTKAASFTLSEEEAAVPEQAELLKLIQRLGGRLETTEDPELFQKAGALAREMGENFHALLTKAAEMEHDPEIDITDMQLTLISEGLSFAFRNLARFEEVNRLRDEAISANIDGSLGEGETGILFLGLEHSVQDFLPEDIEVHKIDVEMDAEIEESKREFATEQTRRL